MKTTKVVLNFCIDNTFYNHYSIERVIKLNQIRDCIFIILSEYDYRDEKIYLRVLGNIDDKSLIFIDKGLENFFDEVNILRVGLLQ